jgi:hypothetical protein
MNLPQKRFGVGGFLLLVLVAISGGCTSYETRTYEITVTNRGGSPVTVWITKDGDPFEESWASPEDIVKESPKESDRFNGVVIPPGRTGHTKITGQFLAQTHAVLRVYRAVKLDAILSLSHGSPSRVEMLIPPGASNISISENDDRIVAEPQAP